MLVTYLRRFTCFLHPHTSSMNCMLIDCITYNVTRCISATLATGSNRSDQPANDSIEGAGQGRPLRGLHSAGSVTDGGRWAWPMKLLGWGTRWEAASRWSGS